MDRPHGLGQTFSVIAAAGAVDGFGLNVCEELGFSSVRKKGGQKEIWMPLATGGGDFPAAIHARRIPGSVLNGGVCGCVLVQAWQ